MKGVWNGKADGSAGFGKAFAVVGDHENRITDMTNVIIDGVERRGEPSCTSESLTEADGMDTKSSSTLAKPCRLTTEQAEETLQSYWTASKRGFLIDYTKDPFVKTILSSDYKDPQVIFIPLSRES